ncbi:type II secretion system F family protein [Streptomyces sp. B1866]|uniref:type II secretion system F family protein n=1 Tax=Streptomyces sp. B1866 TaxID=3075431 RepID=UPI00289122D6|nr:type II secretion system F family protein [Streptomyces sp. B1866]MDT3395165.1 type II secretion system F family protein [Streptomyces sp. B1866]
MSADVVHRLGITVSVAAAALCAALVAAEVRRGRTGRRRLVALLGGQREPERRGGRVRRPWLGAAAAGVKAWLPAAGAVLCGLVLVGGPLGCAAGLAAGYAAVRWRRSRTSGGQAGPGRDGDGGRAARQLPLAADLLAACLAAGAGPQQAAEAVGRSLGGPVGERLALAAAELRLGGDPAKAWGRVGELPGARALATCLERAGTTGVPAVESVSMVAVGCRAEQARAAAERARRAGVLATVPLGLCFLPAFLLLGVAPVLIGLADGLASGG